MTQNCFNRPTILHGPIADVDHLEFVPVADEYLLRTWNPENLSLQIAPQMVTAQKMKFSTKGLFSKCDQILKNSFFAQWVLHNNEFLRNNLIRGII